MTNNLIERDWFRLNAYPTTSPLNYSSAIDLPRSFIDELERGQREKVMELYKLGCLLVIVKPQSVDCLKLTPVTPSNTDTMHVGRFIDDETPVAPKWLFDKTKMPYRIAMPLHTQHLQIVKLVELEAAKKCFVEHSLVLLALEKYKIVKDNKDILLLIEGNVHIFKVRLSPAISCGLLHSSTKLKIKGASQ